MFYQLHYYLKIIFLLLFCVGVSVHFYLSKIVQCQIGLKFLPKFSMIYYGIIKYLNYFLFLTIFQQTEKKILTTYILLYFSRFVINLPSEELELERIFFHIQVFLRIQKITYIYLNNI